MIRKVLSRAIGKGWIWGRGKPVKSNVKPSSQVVSNAPQAKPAAPSPKPPQRPPARHELHYVFAPERRPAFIRSDGTFFLGAKQAILDAVGSRENFQQFCAFGNYGSDVASAFKAIERAVSLVPMSGDERVDLLFYVETKKSLFFKGEL